MAEAGPGARPVRAVLFICTGNLFRSAIAEGVMGQALREAGLDHIEVASAGTAAALGLPAASTAVRVCAEHGIDLSGHRSQPLTAALIRRADLILGMEESHTQAARALAPEAAPRIHLLRRFAPQGPAEEEIADPINAISDEVYRSCFREIRDCVRGLIAALQQGGG